MRLRIAYRQSILSLVALSLLTLAFINRHDLYLTWKYSVKPRDTGWVTGYGYEEGQLHSLNFGAGYVGVPVVDAVIDGTLVPMILDTGTRGVASLDDERIEALGLKILDHVDWRDSGGKVQARVPVASAEKFSIGPVEIQNVRISGMGPESITGRRKGFVGTVGWGAFINHRLSMDYANGLMAVSPDPLPGGFESCESRVVMNVISPEHLPGLLLVRANWGGGLALAQLDTGKSSTVFDVELFDPADIADQDIRIGDFRVPTRHARFGSLRGLGPQGGPPVVIGLGSDFLAQFLVTIDYPRKKVVLERHACA